MDLRDRSDEELLGDITKLVGSQRELTAKLVAHLAEIEERRLHQKKWMPAACEPVKTPKPAPPAMGEGALPTAVFEKVRSALRGMGFRDVEARRVIATVTEMRSLENR